MAKGSFSLSEVLALERFLHYGGTIAADFGYHTNILKSGEGVVY